MISSISNETPETKKKGCAGDIIGSTFVLGIALITLAGLVIKKGKNN
jgi:LPXTG-motif cell wall-anchored protein